MFDELHWTTGRAIAAGSSRLVGWIVAQHKYARSTCVREPTGLGGCQIAFQARSHLKAVEDVYRIGDVDRDRNGRTRHIERPARKRRANAAPCRVDRTTFCRPRDRKSTRLNSSHVEISYAVFCLKKK